MNRDVLHGRLVAASPEGYGIRWKASEARSTSPIGFAMKAVSLVTFRQRPASIEQCSATIELTNNDVLPGDAISLDRSALVLDTPYAGKIRIKKIMIRQINLRAGVQGRLIYAGPNSAEEWSEQLVTRGASKAWKFRNGALYATSRSATCGDFGNLPQRMTIEFRIAWRGRPSLELYLFCKEASRSKSRDYYLLGVDDFGSSLWRCTAYHGSNEMVKSEYDGFKTWTPGSADFALFIDKEERSFALFVDGRRMWQRRDPKPFAGPGNAMLFQSRKADLRIDGLRVREWNGVLPSSRSVSGERKKDLLRLVNNDELSGALTSISAGKAYFRANRTTLEVPLKDIADIRMSTKPLERARRNVNDIRARIGEVGAITVSLKKLKDDRLSGSSENLGEIHVDTGALESIEFNIHEDKYKEVDDFDV